MNKLEKRFLSSTIFLVILVSFVNISGIWNPFKKSSWEKLGKDIEKGVTTGYKEVKKGVTTGYKEVKKGVTTGYKEVTELSKGVATIVGGIVAELKREPKIRGWTVRPTASTKLHEFVWVCTHNSFSSSAHKYGAYRQQNTSMVNQMKAGVRGLMLDVWVANGKVRLTHGPPKYDKFLRPLTFTEGMRFVEELKRMKREFFDKDRKAVVFFILEDHVSDRNLLSRSLEQSDLARRILKPSEWNPAEKEGWPTIAWMNKHGKQIIVFSRKSETKYIYQTKKTIVENHWDNKLNKQEASVVDVSKIERYLYLFNFFKDPASGLKEVKNPVDFFRAAGGLIKGLHYSEINSNKLRDAIYYAINQGPIVIRDRYPNFLTVDFVEKGNVFGIADELNRKASTRKSRVFRAITAEKEEEMAHETEEHTGSWY